MDQAEREGVPLFTGGEEKGVTFYENALGFQRIAKTEYWLNKDGVEISRQDVNTGNNEWRKTNGGVSGSEVVWYPNSYLRG